MYMNASTIRQKNRQIELFFHLGSVLSGSLKTTEEAQFQRMSFIFRLFLKVENDFVLLVHSSSFYAMPAFKLYNGEFYRINNMTGKEIVKVVLKHYDRNLSVGEMIQPKGTSYLTTHRPHVPCQSLYHKNSRRSHSFPRSCYFLVEYDSQIRY